MSTPPTEPPKVRIVADGKVLMDSTGNWQEPQLESAVNALKNPTSKMTGRNVLFASLLDALTGNDEEWTVTKTKLGPNSYSVELVTAHAEARP